MDKSLDPTNTPVNDEIREERQELRDLKLMGELTVPSGHTVYEYDFKTNKLKPAEYEHTSTLDITRGAMTSDAPDAMPIGTIIKGKIKFDPEKMYFTALNWKNAVRKLNNEMKAVDDENKG